MRYVIAGFGKFGRIALERLTESFPRAGVTVLEPHAIPPSGMPASVRWIAEDAVAFLRDARDLAPDHVIVPMVPFHLAAAWIVARSSDVVQTPLPASLSALLPHAFALDSQNVCASRADFLCPDDCPEGDRCTVTGEPRDSLFSTIAGITLPGVSVLVLRSFQILPGVGGYTVGDFLALERQMTRGRYVLATSCKCHAIVTGLEKTR